MKMKALGDQRLLNLGCRVGIEVPQNMWAALDQRYRGAESGKELRRLDGDGAATEHDQGARQVIEIQRGITGEVAGLLQ